MEEKYPQFQAEAERFWFFQRLDYLLHIPVSAMGKDNEVCWQVIKELKSNRKKIKKNQYLTQKEKKNLLILSYVPRFSKRCHGIVMKLKHVK